MIRDWNFNGRYGDDIERVRVTMQPDNLPKYIKAALFKYDDKKIGFFRKDDDEYKRFFYSKAFQKIMSVGLARETGNAWNHNIMWARGMQAWIKKQQKK